MLVNIANSDQANIGKNINNLIHDINKNLR